MVSSARKPDRWLLPGGGINPGELSAACALREAREEVGYTVVPMYSFLSLCGGVSHALYASSPFVPNAQVYTVVKKSQVFPLSTSKISLTSPFSTKF